MTRMLMLAAILAMVAMTGSAQSTQVTLVDREKVAAALAKGGALVTAPDLTVQGIHRAGPGQVEIHAKETDIFYITDGEATIVTGGTMVGGRQTAPNQLRGSDVKGGESRHLRKGDVIVIPAGVPHWFKEVSPSINYLTVKVIKP
jgi:mannose-6-phosphate isomerase-like protein (cupin superfamily)